MCGRRLGFHMHRRVTEATRENAVLFRANNVEIARSDLRFRFDWNKSFEGSWASVIIIMITVARFRILAQIWAL